MKSKLLSLVLVVMVVMAGCGVQDDAADKVKKSATAAGEKIKNIGVCEIVKQLRTNYDKGNDSGLGNEVRDIAKDQFKNALEALKPLVPKDMRGALDELRSSDAPLDPADYSPAQKAARTQLDTYFQDTCGTTIG